jgi:hypothetical protein
MIPWMRIWPEPWAGIDAAFARISRDLQLPHLMGSRDRRKGRDDRR